MAGMEQLEIHSKSYFIRWVEVPAGFTISWSLQPHKKSINFGVFKHPGGSPSRTLPPSISTRIDRSPRLAPTTGQSSPSLQAQIPSFAAEKESVSRVRSRSGSLNKEDTSTAPGSIIAENFHKIGLKLVAWTGKCEADRVSMGHYDVADDGAGMYGLVFDNTLSKTHSKTVTFVLMTYPTNVPPKSLAQLSGSSQLSVRSKSDASSRLRSSPSLKPSSDSMETVTQELPLNSFESSERQNSNDRLQTLETKSKPDGSFYTGMLQKKRRKKNQGYARRFFSLDFKTSTLSYYKSRNSSALRGAIPLSLAAVGTDEKSRNISVDSGAEVWILKASSRKDFVGWRDALERASQNASQKYSALSAQAKSGRTAEVKFDAEAENEWSQVEELVGKVVGITDAMRRLAKDTDPKYAPTMRGLNIISSNGSQSGAHSPVETGATDYFQTQDRSSKFWKRKSTSSASGIPAPSKRNLTYQKGAESLAVPSPTSETPSSINYQSLNIDQPKTEHVHDHCLAVLRDLDSVLSEFSSLINQARQRRHPPELEIPLSRRSTETTATGQEFFDAEDHFQRPMSQLLDIRRDPESDNEERDDVSQGYDSAMSSDDENETRMSIVNTRKTNRESYFGAPLPKSLYPLPHSSISRRTTVAPSSGPPPSLISFLRKNVGKDLTTIAMPVTSNEPISLLQRQAEQLEYSSLLDAACKAPAEGGERILYLAAFAISSLSSTRSKERAIRKPFNPMLGETYELVREDLRFRFFAEKISHRPVQVACQAEHKDWIFLHSPLPTQKFWGKSAELITEGRIRIALNNSGEQYSWAPATCFLRNIIAGEKYVEPVQTITINQETPDGSGQGQGRTAVITFKAGGMFSGRNEEVSVQAFSEQGSLLPLGLAGKWTSSLSFTGNNAPAGREAWSVGELVREPAQHYGFTTFSAQLNEITALESGALPRTDSRCRPDQRKYEEGDVDAAEALKLKLEEGQRRRRKEMEAEGVAWTPKWFEEAAKDGEETIWKLKTAPGEGYWDVREAVVASKGSKWDGVLDVFEV